MRNLAVQVPKVPPKKILLLGYRQLAAGFVCQQRETNYNHSAEFFHKIPGPAQNGYDVRRILAIEGDQKPNEAKRAFICVGSCQPVVAYPLGLQ
jgi:hypothetical protein